MAQPCHASRSIIHDLICTREASRQGSMHGALPTREGFGELCHHYSRGQWNEFFEQASFKRATARAAVRVSSRFAS